MVINFLSNVINLQLGTQQLDTLLKIEIYLIFHLSFFFRFQHLTRFEFEFIPHLMSDSLTSGDFSRVALEKLL